MADHRPDVYQENGKWIFRASTLGSCDRRLTAAGLGYEADPIPDAVMKGFQEGQAGEAEVLRMWRDGEKVEGSYAERYRKHDAGMPKWIGLDAHDPASYKQSRDGSDVFPACRLDMLDDDQFTVEWEIVPGIVIRGHMDGVGQCYEAPLLEDAFVGMVGTRVVEEAKLFGPDYYRKWMNGPLSGVTGKDLWAGWDNYAWQVSIYGHATGLDVAFIVGQKIRTQQPDCERERINCTHPDCACPMGDRVNIPNVHVTWVENEKLPISRGQIMAKVLRIKAAMERGELGGCEVASWPCPVRFLGCGGGDEAEKDDPRPRVEVEGIADLVSRWREAKMTKKAADKAVDDLRDEILAKTGKADEASVFVDGDVEVEWVVEDRKGYEVKPSTRRYLK